MDLKTRPILLACGFSLLKGDTMTYKEAHMICWKLNMQQSSVVFLLKIPGLRPSSFRGKAKPSRRKELILESEKQGSQVAKYLRR